MTPSTFALLFGVVFLAGGVMGMIPLFLTSPPIDAPPTTFTILYGYLFGLFPTNLVLNLIHMVVGIWGLTATSPASGGSFSRSIAIFFGLLAILGLVPALNTMFGLIPLHGHDVWLHGGTAAIAAYFGWRSPAGAREREQERRSRLERRQAQVAVSAERRRADRRHGYGDMHPA